MAHFHMQIKQGSDYEVSFTARDPDTNLPINLTSGYVLTGKVGKRYFTSDPALYEWNAAALNIVGLNGSFVVKVPGIHSRLWTFRRVFYDIKVVNSGNNAEVVSVHGPLTLIPTIN